MSFTITDDFIANTIYAYAIVANNSFGFYEDVLTSNGSAIFWSPPGYGQVPTTITPPPAANTTLTGKLWYQTTTGSLYIHYTDVDSSQWVEIGRSQTDGGGSFDPAGTGFESLAIGYHLTDTNDYGIAMGSRPSANGLYSIAFGFSANAASEDSIAIGRSAQATNIDAIAIGGSSTAEGNYAIAIGGSSDALSTHAIAIGEGAYCEGTRGIAIGYETYVYLGVDGIAIGGSYVGAEDGIAIGRYAAAEAQSAIAIGTQASADGDLFSMAIGVNSFAQENGSIAIGLSSFTYARDATSIGTGASSNGGGAIAIGDDATAAQPLAISIGSSRRSYDGFGNDTGGFGTSYAASTTANSGIAIGSETIAGFNAIAIGQGAVCNWPALPYTNPNHHSPGSIAIGHNANASRNDCIAIGTNATVESDRAVVIGKNASAPATSTEAVVIGNEATSEAIMPVVIGNYASAGGYSGIAIGSWSETTDEGGIAIGGGANVGQMTRSTGVDAISIGHETLSSALGSTAIGYEAAASATGSVSIGFLTNASGDYSVAIGRATVIGDYATGIGYTAEASGRDSIAIGNDTDASAPSSVAMGDRSEADKDGMYTRASMDGYKNQYFSFVCNAYTADATTSTNLNPKFPGPNTMILTEGTAWAFKIIVLAVQGSGVSETATWRFTGTIHHPSGAAALIGSIAGGKDEHTAGATTWTCTVSADTITDALQISVTGDSDPFNEVLWTAFVDGVQGYGA